AEDGIRDRTVTGVQTCALPISVQALPELQRTQDKSPRALRARRGEGWYTEMGTYAITAFTTENATTPPADLVAFFHTMEESLSRSEERRVGKECRSGRSTYHYK